MSLYGKGWFVWQVARCEAGSPAAMADKAVGAGLTHVVLKIAERTHAFGIDRNGLDRLLPVARALRERGLDVWGWHYVYGDEPVEEARAALRRVAELQLDGYVVDAEAEYRQANKAAAARAFMATLRAGLPVEVTVALSSYRYPSLHKPFPWQAFLEECDLSMPQVYWEQAHNSDQQLARSVAEFGNADLVGHVRPVFPTGSAYRAGNWRAAAADLVKFLNKAQELGLAGANFYSWDYATTADNTDLWQAVADYDWVSGAGWLPDHDLIQRYFEALNSGDPARVLPLYQADAGHVTAARTLIGQEALAGWYQELLTGVLPGAVFKAGPATASGNSRHFTWTAAGPTGQVTDGDDTLGLVDGRIQYHYTHFTFKRDAAHGVLRPAVHAPVTPQPGRLEPLPLRTPRSPKWNR